MRRTKRYEPVNYSARQGDRRRLANYLKAGGCRKIAGSYVPGRDTLKRRIMLYSSTGLVIIIGSIYMFF